MPSDLKDARSLVAALTLGALGGAAIVQSHRERDAKSQAEKDDPEGCEWLCNLIWDLLDDWMPADCESEDDFTDDLVDYLRANLGGTKAPGDGRRIRVARRVRTDYGIPDVRIDDRLVLELKVGPHEGEKDRLIGQCCKYSVEWVTWAIMIDMEEGKRDELVRLLDKKSLHYIEVIPFDAVDCEDEDDDSEEEDDEAEYDGECDEE